MTLEQLRIFIAVAERQHVTRAAEALNITQSAASNAIAALEAQYGVPFFHRIGRRIELTEAGAMFLDEARAVLGRVSAAELALAEYGGLYRGTVRIVASQTVASYWLPGKLAGFHARYPDIAIELSIDNSQGAARRVLDGTAELGVVEGAIDEPALAAWKVGEDRMLLVGPSPARVVDEDWLLGARWIVREQGSGTRSSFEHVLRARGIDPQALTIAMVMPSNEAVRSAVEAGAGVAVLSEFVVRRALAEGCLYEQAFAMPARPFYALRHKERYRTRMADALVESLGENLP